MSVYRTFRNCISEVRTYLGRRGGLFPIFLSCALLAGCSSGSSGYRTEDKDIELTGDRVKDRVSIVQDGQTDKVVVCEGLGFGRFKDPETVIDGPGGDLKGFRVSDVDGDGRPDVSAIFEGRLHSPDDPRNYVREWVVYNLGSGEFSEPQVLKSE